MLSFLRNLDKRKLIFILQRAVAILLPIRYPDCENCMYRQTSQINGIAIGRNSASVEIYAKARQQYPPESRIQMA